MGLILGRSHVDSLVGNDVSVMCCLCAKVLLFSPVIWFLRTPLSLQFSCPISITMGCHQDQVGRLCLCNCPACCSCCFVLFTTGESFESLASFSQHHKKKKSSLERPWGSVGQLYDRRVDPEKLAKKRLSPRMSIRKSFSFRTRKKEKELSPKREKGNKRWEHQH